MPDVTRLLNAASGGDRKTAADLLPFDFTASVLASDQTRGKGVGVKVHAADNG